jgi:hypothetical protein
MKHGMLKIVICMALVLSLATTGLCALLTSHQVNTSCQKSRSMGKITAAGASGSCEMLPCHSKKGQPVLLPDAWAGRFKTEDRRTSLGPGPVAVPASFTLLLDTRPFKAFYDLPLSFYPPPLFHLHCSLIC